VHQGLQSLNPALVARWRLRNPQRAASASAAASAVVLAAAATEPLLLLPPPVLLYSQFVIW